MDILVEFNDRIGTEFIDLANEIERLLGVKTDLIAKRAIKPKYLDVIQSDLTYVWSRSEIAIGRYARGGA